MRSSRSQVVRWTLQGVAAVGLSWLEGLGFKGFKVQFLGRAGAYRSLGLQRPMYLISSQDGRKPLLRPAI